MPSLSYSASDNAHTSCPFWRCPPYTTEVLSSHAISSHIGKLHIAPGFWYLTLGFPSLVHLPCPTHPLTSHPGFFSLGTPFLSLLDSNILPWDILPKGWMPFSTCLFSDCLHWADVLLLGSISLGLQSPIVSYSSSFLPSFFSLGSDIPLWAILS